MIVAVRNSQAIVAAIAGIARAILIGGLFVCASSEVTAQNAVVQLTRTGARNGQPFVSPDGQSMSFVSNRSGSWQVWLMPSQGGDARQLTHAVEPVGWPSWSRDGRTLLFYMRTADGYRLHRLDLDRDRVSAFGDPGIEGFRPLVSPDGERLLYDRVIPSDRLNHEIFARDLARGVDMRLTFDPGYDSDARWSPDGTQIAFHSDRGADRQYATQVYVMRSDGSDVRRLTDGPAVHAYPTWSPDGRFLAHTAELEGNRDIWIMRVDGVTRARVTSHEGFDGDPIWAPDGKHLIFATERFGGQELALVDVSTILRKEPGDLDACRVVGR